MAKSKFPLTLHPTGHYCKKIHGKVYYFGKDRREALERYYAQAAALHGQDGRCPVAVEVMASHMPIETLCNLYLDHQATAVKGGDITPLRYVSCRSRLRPFVKYLGQSRVASEVTPADLEGFRDYLINRGLAPATVTNGCKAVKALFNWAKRTGRLSPGPDLAVLKPVKGRKIPKHVFTPEEIDRLLAVSGNVQMRAMILLGLNCGFGPTDCGRLGWNNLDLDGARVHYPRCKTGVDRSFSLWPDTVAALRATPVRGPLVFYTREGNPYDFHAAETTYVNPITQLFRYCIRRAGMKVDKGTGFYTLRRTGATVIAQTGDVFAVQAFLGHSSLQEAMTYVQTYKLMAQTDKATAYLVAWLQHKASPTTPDGSVRLAS